MKVVLGILVTTMLLGCGVETARAPRENVEPLELRSFPRQSWRLVNNKFFLWREDMTPEHASRAIAIGRILDDLDGQAIPLNRRHLDLSNAITPYKDLVKALNRHLLPIRAAVTKITRKKTETEGQLAQEKEKTDPDAAVIASLEATVQALEEQLAELGKVKERLEKDIDEQKGSLAPLEEELAEVEAQQLVIEEAGRARVDEIMTVVEWYKDQPTAVTFQFQPDGSISASISGWNLGDDAGARNFSTEHAPDRKPTMGNVTYTELGGIFEFDAYVFEEDGEGNQGALRETYHFRIGRIKYDYPDGRIFFGGDITRTDAAGRVRRGLAKLVDRNN